MIDGPIKSLYELTPERRKMLEDVHENIVQVLPDNSKHYSLENASFSLNRAGKIELAEAVVKLDIDENVDLVLNREPDIRKLFWAIGHKIIHICHMYNNYGSKVVSDPVYHEIMKDMFNLAACFTADCAQYDRAKKFWEMAGNIQKVKEMEEKMKNPEWVKEKENRVDEEHPYYTEEGVAAFREKYKHRPLLSDDEFYQAVKAIDDKVTALLAQP